MIEETHRDLEGLSVLMLLDNPFVSDARVEKEARTLVQQGVNLIVLGTMSDKLSREETRNGYRIIRGIPDGYNAPLRRGYKTYIQKCVDLICNYRFDILHCHDFYMLSIGVAYKKQFPETILIYDAHEYLKGWPYYLTSKGVNKLKGKLVWNRLVQKEKKEAKHADAVISITNSIAGRMKRDFKLKSTPIVIGNYPIPAVLSKKANFFHDGFNLEPGTKVIIHSGTIYQTDNELSILFNAIQSLENVVLVFIGDRPRFYTIKEKVENNSELNQKIFFQEYIHNYAELLNMMAAANFGLLHINASWEAHKIGFSNRFVEYIMADLPVIGTPQEFAIDVNNQLECGVFYNEPSTAAIKNSIQQAIQSESQLKLNVFKLRERFNWNVESKKLIDLYKSLIHGK